MKKLSFKKMIIEALKFFIMIIVIANIVSFIRKPHLKNSTLPDLNVTSIDGKKLSLHKQNKPIILYFWGTWCPVCKVQSPQIEKLLKTYNVISIAVNSGSSKEIQTYQKKHEFHFLTIADQDGKISQKFQVNTFPTIFVYDKKGINIFTEVGYTSQTSIKLKIWVSHFL